MKILHISTGFKLSFQGGITNYVRALADSQVQSGHDVTVIGDPDDTTFAYKYVSGFTGTIPPFYLGKLEDKVHLNKLKQFLARESFDIIHIHMPLGLDWDLYTILKEYRYVVSLHDYFYICPRIQMIDKNKKLCSEYNEEKCRYCISKLESFRMCRGMLKIARKISRNENLCMPYIAQKVTVQRHIKFKKLLENARIVIPVSQRVKEIYLRSGFEANYTVLHIGNISAEHYKHKYMIDRSNRKLRIGILGSMTYYKGADLVIEFAEKLDSSKYELHFWGRPLKYEDALRKAGVFMHGAYMQKDLPHLLENIDLGFVMSIWEDNGPQVVMEFLNNRVPVIGTRLGGIIDFVNEKNGYLFDPYSDVEKKNTIKFLNSLSLDDIYRLKEGITRTILPSEHYQAIQLLYEKIIYSETE